MPKEFPMQMLPNKKLLLKTTALLAIAATGFCLSGVCPAQGKKFPKAEWVDSNRTEPNGTKYKTFASKVLGADVSYLVYLPPGYDKEAKRYPVIFWLHGLGGGQRGGATNFVPHVDAAIRKGALPACIVVLVNGMVNSWYCDWANGKLPIESVIIKDLIPHIDATYRTVAKREGRVVQGYSMGGYGAAHLAFKYPEVFGTVVVDAGALVGEAAFQGKLGESFKEIYADKDRFLAEHPTKLLEKNVEKIRNKTGIRIGCGKDDGLLPRNQELHELLDRLKIEHQYEVVPGVAHNAVEYYKKLDSKGFEIHRKILEALDGGK
jgi:enterochelin esterase-like enzyme